jgi:hypothetical protein
VLKPFDTTGIGSLPFRDPEEAVGLILSSCDIPFWPQLPRRSFRELMIPQYSEGLPGCIIDTVKEKVLIEDAGQDELNRFYELFSDDGDFPASEESARGFYTFIERIKGQRFRLLKGQITGPLTFTLGLKKSDGRYIYFDEELREVSLLLLERKARWQIRVLSEFADKVIIFVDEPILTAIGSSSYLGVEPREGERLLTDIISSIKSNGALAGIHCCGKADWGMLTRTGADILNFDAFDYYDTLHIYTGEIGEFIKNGGFLAWGMVPTTAAINETDIDMLKERMISGIKGLASDLPEDLIVSHSLLTPSCGAGSRTTEEARKVFSLLRSLGEAMTGDWRLETGD